MSSATSSTPREVCADDSGLERTRSGSSTGMIHLNPAEAYSYGSNNIHGNVQKSFFASYVKDGEKRKLLHYDLKLLVQLGGIGSMFAAGTVFTMDWNVFKSLVVTVLIAVASALMATVVDFGDTTSIESLSLQINQFVPFVLGMYVSLTLARWWALRTQALGRIFQSISDISMLMAAALPEDKWAPLHDQVTKLGVASIYLVCNAARDRADLSKIKEECLLTNEEAAVLEPVQLFQRAVAVWSWIMRLTEYGLKEGKQPIPKVIFVQGRCCMAREGIQTIHTYLLTQLPFAYVHLLAWLVNIQNVVVAVKSGIVVEEAARLGDTAKVVQELIMCALVCLLYQGLLSISYVVQDPFGDDLLDFPIEAYTQYVLASIRAMHLAVSNCHPLDKVKEQYKSSRSHLAPVENGEDHDVEELQDDDASDDGDELDDAMDDADMGGCVDL